MAQEKNKPQETQVEFLASLASTLVMVLFIMTFIGQTFAIPSSSMENTLLIGDHLFVNRIGFAPRSSYLGPLLPYRTIQRGDIVVLFSPIEKDLHLVKRVIGIPGDRIHLRNAVLYRNGQKVDEPYVIHSGPISYDPYRDNFPSGPPDAATPAWQENLPQQVEGEDLVVPAGRYFVMGDNRDVSYDSRYWGFVPRQNIIGQPLGIYWSFEATAADYTTSGFLDRAKNIALTAIHFFDRTRWRRSFHGVR